MQGLSPYIKDQILAGQAVLFLGAGASIAATGQNGQHGLSGTQLKDKLCDKFLGGASKSRPLNYVADRCMSVAGMGAVHRHLKELMVDLQPTPGHRLIPKFRWKGIATTNYDFLTEKAYEADGERMQQLERIIWDRDDFGSVTRNPGSMAYLKLHGCLNRLNDPELPLVLSSHDYYRFKANRGQMVSTLREWGLSCPIIFCGYSISDENVKEILYDLSDRYLGRPQYALVDPGLDPGDIDYWKSQRFDCLPLSFSEFMSQLRESISATSVTLGALQSNDISITKLIPSHTKPSPAVFRYLEKEIQHVHGALLTQPISPRDFYRGNSDGFAWVQEGYDIRRRVVDTLISDVVLETGKSNLPRPYFYVVSGYAGSGKSVTLKRFAWEAGSEYEAAVFYVGAGATLRVGEITELARLICTRILVVIDDALVHKDEIKQLLTECKKNRLPVTIVAGARTNQWNTSASELEAEVDAEYELLDLNRHEVDHLIAKLEATNCLGYLAHLTPIERTTYFLDKLKSQLLVALHEATEGKSFEEIVSDEYARIHPPEAKLLYLDVCTLDRFDVGVRAGLMSRISGVTFDSFSKRLLRPLEHVILVSYDHRAGDYVYRSRHQHIAELVFDSALNTQQERAIQIVRLLRYLNGSYESDRIAIQQLVKGRLLATQFSDRALVAQIFEAALESGLHASVVDHQRAVFEMHHPHGDLRSAMSIMSRVEQNPGTLSSKSISHTKANILRRLASAAKTDIERIRYRQDALVILNFATRNSRDALPFLTKSQLLLEQLRERMDEGDDNSESEIDIRVVSELTKEIEGTLRQGLQQFPEDERLLSFEAELSKFLNNSPRALKALERAFAKNKESVFTAIRLARQYMENPDSRAKALAMMRKLSSEQPLSKEAHFELARMLDSLGDETNRAEIGQHLKRSFSAGDSHFEARFQYARHQFLYGRPEDARKEFLSLSKIPLNPGNLNQARAEVRDVSGNPIWFDGTIFSLHDSFAFIRCVNFHDDIFMHFKSMTPSEDWESLTVGEKVKFTLGFAYKGPKAKKVHRVK